MASSASKNPASKPILKMPVLAPSKFGGGSNLDPPTGEDGGGGGVGGGVGGGGGLGSKTQFPGLKKSKLASLPLVANASLQNTLAKTEAIPEVLKAAAAFIPLTNTEPPLATGQLERPPQLPQASPHDDDRRKDKAKEEVNKVFVFGEKIHDRAENFDVKEAAVEATDPIAPVDPQSKKESTDEAAVPLPRKTLSESAAEYCETHAQKRRFEEVKLVTGEEDESNVLQIAAKLHVFEKSNSTWMERGRGLLRLNDVKASEGAARIVMRTTGSLRVILNTPLYAGMSVEKPTDKTIRLTGTDEGQVKIFLISAAPKDIQDLFSSVSTRQQAISQAATAVAVDEENPAKKRNSN